MQGWPVATGACEVFEAHEPGDVVEHSDPIPVVEGLPRRVSDMTPAWLGEVLGRPISKVSVEPIGVGVGMLGELARLHLTYEGVPGDGPASIIAKVPTAVEGNNELAGEYGLYQNEVNFYLRLGGSAPVRTPRCFLGAMNPTERRYVLLLEDLVGHRLVDQIEGMTVAQAEVSLRAIARFHARWWQTPELGELVWLADGTARAQAESAQPTVPELWPAFRDRWGDRLSDQALCAGAAIMARYPVLQFSMAFNPMTLIHADFRLDNLFFSPDGGEVVVIDWQLLSRGPAVYDVAYLLTQSMSPDVRREHETDLLKAWHDELERCGVRSYEFDQLARDFDVAVLVALAAPLGATTIDLGNERGERLAFTMADRALAAVLDRDWQEVLARF